MMAKIEFAGVDLENLDSQVIEYPKTVPGRVTHIDADFAAYMVSAFDDVSFEDMTHNLDVMRETLRLMSGAERTQLHLTPSSSNKGFRFEIAIQKEYQGNRQDKPKPKLLNAVRSWMHQHRNAYLWKDQEADDGLAQALYREVGENPKLSVLVSKDKDLRMVPGYHMDWDTGDITFIGEDDLFGWISLYTPEPKEKEDGSYTKPAIKLIGRGTKFFWAQMLMGDGADNIQGIQKVPGKTKWKSCGLKAAYELLANVESDKEAFTLIRDLYRDCEQQVGGYRHWKTGEPKTWQQVFKSEAALLWMRRKESATDVLDWFMETCR